MIPVASPLGIVYAQILKHAHDGKTFERPVSCRVCRPYAPSAEEREADKVALSCGSDRPDKKRRGENRLPAMSPADLIEIEGLRE